MKRLIVLTLAAAALVAPVAARADALTGVDVTQASGARFPDRILTLGLPKKLELTPARLTVLENGQPVLDLQVVPAEAAQRGSFGVVLAIDASNSMRGAAIKGALAAARVFLTQRSPNEQVAILVFNRETRVVHAFTTDGNALSATLINAPPLAEGTHIYDAVQAALDLIGNSSIKAGSIVVLSDGADTGSRARGEDVASAVQRAHVRIFTVGLRSSQFSPGTLTSLAAKTGGAYALAGSAAELTAIYRDLGARLSREYLVHYRSTAGPGKKIQISVKVDGVKGVGVSTYKTPTLPVEVVPPYHRSFGDKFLQSSASTLIVALLAAGLVSMGISLLLKPERGLRRRMAEFVSVGRPAAERASGQLSERVLVGAERSLEQTRWWGWFKLQVELAEIKMAPVQIVLWTLVATIILGWVVVQITGSVLLSILGLVVPYLVYELISRRVSRRRRLFADQLPDSLQVLASALRAGHSLVGALSVVVEDAPEPTRSEFRRVVADERLGVPLEDAIEVVVKRMESRDLAQVGLVAALQRRTGGNSAEVLDRVVDTIRDRAALRRLVRTLTTQGRMSRWILTGLPLVLLLAIVAINPNYIAPLFEEPGGRILLVVSAFMSLIGSLAIRRIVNIKI